MDAIVGNQILLAALTAVSTSIGNGCSSSSSSSGGISSAAARVYTDEHAAANYKSKVKRAQMKFALKCKRYARETQKEAEEWEQLHGEDPWEKLYAEFLARAKSEVRLIKRTLALRAKLNHQCKPAFAAIAAKYGRARQFACEVPFVSFHWNVKTCLVIVRCSILALNMFD